MTHELSVSSSEALELIVSRGLDVDMRQREEPARPAQDIHQTSRTPSFGRHDQLAKVQLRPGRAISLPPIDSHDLPRLDPFK